MSFAWGGYDAPPPGGGGEALGRPRSLRSGRPHRCQPPCLLLGAHRSAQHVIGRTDESISLVLLTGVPADWPSSLGLLVVCLLEKYRSLQSWVILRHPHSCCLFALTPDAGGSKSGTLPLMGPWGCGKGFRHGFRSFQSSLVLPIRRPRGQIPAFLHFPLSGSSDPCLC